MQIKNVHSTGACRLKKAWVLKRLCCDHKDVGLTLVFQRLPLLLTPLDASTSSDSSSLCSMCISKGFPSWRYCWKRDRSSRAGPVPETACLLGETDGERHWPMNLNSWVGERGGRGTQRVKVDILFKVQWTSEKLVVRKLLKSELKVWYNFNYSIQCVQYITISLMIT